MLVLSRRLNEQIILPDLNVAVHVLEIKGDRVRLGFEAPRSVTVLRGELVPQEPQGSSCELPARSASP